MLDYRSQLCTLDEKLKAAKTVLLTSPGVADGDSIGTQLALRRMILQRYPSISIYIVNDEELPPRYRFLPDVAFVDTPESFQSKNLKPQFDVAIAVDGGIDRAGRVKAWYEKANFQVFIDHHAISFDYPYHLRIVNAEASATTQILYELSQTDFFKTKIDSDIAQFIYLGLIFDTGFFRHSNTTAEVMELGAKLLRVGFDFTRVGERGLLERTFPSLQLMWRILSDAKLEAKGKLIWSQMSQSLLKQLGAHDDDKEGVIDHLFLTKDIEVAVLFIEMPNKSTKISFRSHGKVDVASFARNITERGGGHKRAAGANIEKDMTLVIQEVLPQIIEVVEKES